MSSDRAEQELQKEVQRIINLKDTFESEKGIKVLYDLCKRFHYFQPSYQGDANDCIFREGERNVINFIMSQLQQNPADILDRFRKQQKEELEDAHNHRDYEVPSDFPIQ